MKHAVFVSPHLDDAVFSAGAMMLKLQKLGYAITVLNVCSDAGTLPQTLSAKAYLRQIGYESAEQLYRDRREEDTKALDKMGVKAVRMGYTEALWRKRQRSSTLRKLAGKLLAEWIHVYPTYKFHIASGKIASEDERFITDLSKKIQTLVPKDSILFCPLGIGGHIDHVIARRACEHTKMSIVYWADIPYVVRPNVLQTTVDTSTLKKFEISTPAELGEKEKYCKMYTTQYKPVFDTLRPRAINETYFYTQRQAQSYDRIFS